jgi:hypothetical protein
LVYFKTSLSKLEKKQKQKQNQRRKESLSINSTLAIVLILDIQNIHFFNFILTINFHDKLQPLIHSKILE